MLEKMRALIIRMLAAEEVVAVVNLKLGQLKLLRGRGRGGKGVDAVEEETIYVNL